MTEREALRLALDALEFADDFIGMEPFEHVAQETADAHKNLRQSITAIKQALEETQGVSPEPEPVAYGMWDTMIGCGGRMMMVRLDKGQDGCTVPLYNAPPKREPLTNGEIYTAYITATNQTLRAQDERLAFAFARAIEAAHGIGEKK